MAYISVDLDKETRVAIKEALGDMAGPVDVYVFISENCEYCGEAVKLMKMLRDLSPVEKEEHYLRLHIIKKEENSELFEKFGIKRTPTIALIDGVIKYTGLPAGEELRGFIETVIRISEGESGLEDNTKRIIREELKGNVYIEVIVTPQCPYCPYAALMANMFAFEAWKNGRKNIIADTIEAYENPDIADKYGVLTVPTIAVNGEVLFVGLPYEEDFADRIKKLLEGSRVEESVIDNKTSGV